MKKFPTALTVPSNSFSVWLKIAPPLEASALALGRLRGGDGAGVLPYEVSCDGAVA
jgi:hypothetical protein